MPIISSVNGWASHSPLVPIRGGSKSVSGIKIRHCLEITSTRAVLGLPVTIRNPLPIKKRGAKNTTKE
ncbi:hypothetical protein D3C81_2168690 [compost metagenome]